MCSMHATHLYTLHTQIHTYIQTLTLAHMPITRYSAYLLLCIPKKRIQMRVAANYSLHSNIGKLKLLPHILWS